LIAARLPGHESAIIVNVAGGDDFGARGRPEVIATGHRRIEPEIDANHAVRVEICLGVGVPRANGHNTATEWKE
jgi:hypothetical protein